MTLDQQSANERLRSTQSWIEERGLDCLAVYSYRSALTAHWTGYCPRHSVTNASLVLITKTEAVHFTRLPIHQATAETDGSSIRHICAASASWAVASVTDLVMAASHWLEQRRNLRLIGFAAYPPEAGIWSALNGAVPSHLQDVSLEIAEFLAPKNQDDLQALRRAGHVAQQAFDAGIAALRVGGVAGDARKAAESTLRDAGSRTWHCFVGATDSFGRTLLQPDQSRLDPGTTVFFETIPDIDLFCPEVVATVFMGEIPKSAGTVDTAIRSALSAVIQTTTSNSTFGDLYRLMMERLEHAGVSTDSVYRLGHQTGLDNIELPEYFDSKDERRLGNARVISVHPNAAVPGHGTLIRGGTLIVADEECEPLFRFPETPLIVD